jgi:hypothetical protein
MEEQILRVFVNRDLRLRKWWVTKSRRMRWVVYVAFMGEVKNAYILVGKP